MKLSAFRDNTAVYVSGSRDPVRGVRGGSVSGLWVCSTATSYVCVVLWYVALLPAMCGPLVCSLCYQPCVCGP